MDTSEIKPGCDQVQLDDRPTWETPSLKLLDLADAEASQHPSSTDPEVANCS